MPTEQKFQTLLSMQRMAGPMSFYHAQLWINHEAEQTKKKALAAILSVSACNKGIWQGIGIPENVLREWTDYMM